MTWSGKSCMWIAPAVIAVLTAFFSGCLATPARTLRVERYRPDASGRTPWTWDGGDVMVAEDVMNSTSLNVAAESSSPTNESGVVRRFRSGDRIRIFLRDIPTRDDISDQIDESGMINLPLLGVVKVAGMTTSEVEDYLEKKYVEDGYYKRITVIVLAEEEEYFVQGEVNKPGRYILGRGRTLLQAIADAGGYTDYANRKNVEIIRQDDVQVYNCVKIEQRAAEDPLIEPGDIVRVRRRIAPWE